MELNSTNLHFVYRHEHYPIESNIDSTHLSCCHVVSLETGCNFFIFSSEELLLFFLLLFLALSCYVLIILFLIKLKLL